MYGGAGAGAGAGAGVIAFVAAVVAILVTLSVLVYRRYRINPTAQGTSIIYCQLF